MSNEKQLIYGLLLSIAGIFMIIAFMPDMPDIWHYKWRILSEVDFLFCAFLYTFNSKILNSFVLYWLLLATYAGYDDWLGNPYEMTFTELSIAIIATIFFYTLIRKKWNTQK